MKFILIIFFILIVFLLFKLFKEMKMSILMTIICSSIIIIFITFPKDFITYTLNGGRLFIENVFPTLFSFMIISNLMLYFDGVVYYSNFLKNNVGRLLRVNDNSIFAVTISFLCGYPLGAKYSIELYNNGFIDENECNRLLSIASNGGPIFIIGVLGVKFLNSPVLGYILLIGNYISCILISFIIPPSKNKFHGNNLYRMARNEKNLGEGLKNAIDNSIKSTLSIGGYIVIFSMFIDLILQSKILNLFSKVTNLHIGNIIKYTILGSLEMTKGSYLVSTSDFSINLKIFLIGFFLAFSGLSIISQTYSFTYKLKNFILKRFMYYKLIQGLFGGFASLILYLLFTYFN